MVSVIIDNLSKQFGATRVLTDISIEIAPGELFFLLGPSGCGKTTLLRIIAGFADPTAGKVAFDKRDMIGVPPHLRNTGMVFQNYALWPHMTVEENVAFGLDVRGIGSDEKRKKIVEALGLVRMSGYERRYPHQLSGGQQQRVALARALVIQPDVVLLDEPLSNLDAGLRIEMRNEIRRIHQELGFTMVYVTHDQKEALSLATRLAILHNGVLAQVDTPAKLYQDPSSMFVAQFVGETNVLSGKVMRCDSSGITVDTKAGSITCPAARAVAQFDAGTAVDVAIRPEGLQFAAQGAHGQSWPCTIVESTCLGDVVQVVARMGEATVRMTHLNMAAAMPRAGETRPVAINPAHVRIFAAE